MDDEGVVRSVTARGHRDYPAMSPLLFSGEQIFKLKTGTALRVQTIINLAEL